MRNAHQDSCIVPASSRLSLALAATPLTSEARSAYLARFGDGCMAYSSVQKGTEYFHLEGIGFVPYMRQGRRPYVLGDPICAPEERDRLTLAFLQQEPTAAFVQISESHARSLFERFGYRATVMGTETWIDLRHWSLAGSEKALLRRHRNGALNWGIRVRAIDEAELQARRPEIDALKARWLGNRRGKRQSMKFLVRPEEASEPETRKYIAETHAGEIVSYVVCDPLQEDGRIVGYYLDLTFYVEAVPDAQGKRMYRGVNYFTALEIFRQLHQEGLRFATLGMSPLHGLHFAPGEHPGLRRLLSWVWKWGNAIYGFRGMAQYKEAYRGEAHPVFFASRTSGFWDLVAVLRLSNLI